MDYMLGMEYSFRDNQEAIDNFSIEVPEYFNFGFDVIDTSTRTELIIRV